MSFGGAEHVIRINYEILYVLQPFVDWDLGSNIFSKMLEIKARIMKGILSRFKHVFNTIVLANGHL